MTADRKLLSNINAEHSLGKGEVLSSILSGSTRKARTAWELECELYGVPAVSGRTQRKHDAAKRGESVDFVHGSIREDSMTNDNTDQEMYPPISPDELKNAHAYENLDRVVVTEAGAVFGRTRGGGWVRLDKPQARTTT